MGPLSFQVGLAGGGEKAAMQVQDGPGSEEAIEPTQRRGKPRRRPSPASTRGPRPPAARLRHRRPHRSRQDLVARLPEKVVHRRHRGILHDF